MSSKETNLLADLVVHTLQDIHYIKNRIVKYYGP